MSVRVLLVDEEERARKNLAERLERAEGIALVGQAGDVASAGRLMKKTRPDVVLLDLHRRDGEELAVCRAIAGMSAVPVVALASFMTPARWQATRAAGAKEIVLKRVDTGGLSRALARVVERHGKQ